MAKRKPKIIHTVGKRKVAIARATAKIGTGNIFVNKRSLNIWEPETARIMITEPLVLAGDVSQKLDINVNVSGGGVFGQTSAIRQAIAKALVKYEPKLKKKFLDYDRTLLIADVRRNEPHKPSRSKKGPRRHKQRSKR